jgi:hypothetical protein
MKNIILPLTLIFVSLVIYAQDDSTAICIIGGTIYKTKPNGIEYAKYFSTVGYYLSGEKVILQEKPDSLTVFLKIKKGNIIGYVYKRDIQTPQQILFQQQLDAQRVQQQKEAAIKYKNDLIKKYHQTIATKILNQKIWLGMTDKMAIESWGKPDDINRSVGSWGVHEQWVYPDNQYLYFENGKLTSYQN